METVTVSVKQGKLRGVESKSLKGDRFVMFLGIPYAKPPLGPLRFKPPQPPDPWTGVWDATKEGNSSLSMRHAIETTIGDEDCLYMNVYTRNIQQKNKPCDLKPVMVWIHAGMFTIFSCSKSLTGPEVLMQKDIVLAAMNYRLGVLGFLSMEDESLEVPGNAGLKDIVLALRWIQENIESFGGDPKNVTIFGCSSGAAAVHLLMLSPTARGLFHRVIAMSGSALNPWVRGSRNSLEIARALGKEVKTEKEALEIFMKTSAEELFQAQLKIVDNVWDASTVRPFCPVVEKPNPTAFLDREPRDIINSGDYNKMPFMTGFTTAEGLMLGIFQDLMPSGDLSHYFIPYDLGVKKGSQKSEEIAEKIKEQYMRVEDGHFDAASDVLIINGQIETVEKHVTNLNHPIYIYQVSHENKLCRLKSYYNFNDKKGVSHYDDVALLFTEKVRPCEEGSVEERASDRLVALFTNFAKYGDPTPSVGEFGILWPPVEDPANLAYLDIGEKLSLKVAPFPQRMAFWKELRLAAKKKE